MMDESEQRAYDALEAKNKEMESEIVRQACLIANLRLENSLLWDLVKVHRERNKQT